MRIVIDMQGAQSGSILRGIGRYTISFVQALCKNRGKHEIFLILNSLFDNSIENIRSAFDGIIDQKNILTWYCIGPVCEINSNNNVRITIAQKLREYFIASLKPDVVLITALFESGYEENVLSINKYFLKAYTSVLLYDMIPLKFKNYSIGREKYFINRIGLLNNASSCLTISNSSIYDILSYNKKFNELNITNISAGCSETFKKINITEELKRSIKEKYNINRNFFLCVGGCDPRKNIPRLIDAFAAIKKSIRLNYQLVLVGEMPDSYIEERKMQANRLCMMEDELIFTGYIQDSDLLILYNTCYLFIYPSLYEGFGLPILEAMNCGAPVIGSDNSSIKEIINFDLALFDGKVTPSITSKIINVLEDDNLRNKLIENSFKQSKNYSWDNSALKTIRLWEMHIDKQKKSIENNNRSLGKLIFSLLSSHNFSKESVDLCYLSHCISNNHPETSHINILYLDISTIVKVDMHTGIQRVVKAWLISLLELKHKYYKVKPIYLCKEGDTYFFRHAVSYVNNLLNISHENISDETIAFKNGDILLSLDLNRQEAIALTNEGFYNDLRNRGVKIYFTVYDLLPVIMPQMFPKGTNIEHMAWLHAISQGDGAVCISKTVADDLSRWQAENNYDWKNRRPFHINWTHLGADIELSGTNIVLQNDSQKFLRNIAEKPTFLMVGTLEPRKGHLEVLKAFEVIWSAGKSVNLVIVGKKGWMVEELVDKIQKHDQINKKLFWFKSANDQFLLNLYKLSSCLIAASYGEGFGLPLIEAAQYQLPIIARDIPIFREVAGNHAYYFDTEDHKSLADVIINWLYLYKIHKHPIPNEISWSTWSQSAKKLAAIILK